MDGELDAGDAASTQDNSAAAVVAPVAAERAIGGAAAERPLGSSRRGPPAGSSASAREHSTGSMGLAMGDYVPTTREIESGAVKVTEVAPPPEQQCILTEDLEDLEDAEAQLQFAVDNMATRNWAERFDVMHVTRKFVKYRPSCLDSHIASIDKCLVESMKNPRSSIIRESLMLTADLFKCPQLKCVIAEGITWTKLVPALLLKSINDKKFLAVEGTNALDAFAETCPEGYRVFLLDCDNRNTKLAAMAMGTVLSCVRALGERLRDLSPRAGEEEAPLAPLVTSAVKAMLKGKLADMRAHAKDCLERVIGVAGGWDTFVAVYGPRISSGDMKQLGAVFQAGGSEVEEVVPPVAAKERFRHPRAPSRQKATEEVVVVMAPRVETASADTEPAPCAPELQHKPYAEDAVVAADGEAPGSAGNRLRRNSTTPRSRKSSEAVVMEF